MLPPYLELIIQGSELVAFIIAVWKAVRVANRILDVLKDFPPHRHVGLGIIYPEGYTPPPIEKLTSGIVG